MAVASFPRGRGLWMLIFWTFFPLKEKGEGVWPLGSQSYGRLSPIRRFGIKKEIVYTRKPSFSHNCLCRNLPLLVRLSFHDCVGSQGCDGCIDTTNADNAGKSSLQIRFFTTNVCSLCLKF